MSPIKDFTVTYEALNKEDVFSAGDTVKGTVTFTLTKDTSVKSVHVKVKGDANVAWTEGTGDHRRRYHAHRRYCKVKQYLVAENSKGTELSKGAHRYDFSLKIPQGDMPSSFKGFHGSIVYKLEAKIPRSWRIPSIVHRELKFVSKSLPQHNQGPSFGSVGKGEIKMSASVDRTVCFPGDTLSLSAKVCNSSSKTTKPKFSLVQNIVYRAVGSRKYGYQSLCKMVGDPIAPNSEVPVSCQLKIPHDTPYTIRNCDILTVEYSLKVYLDIKFAIDPEVVFPLFISSSSVAHHPGGAIGVPGYSDFLPPASFPPGAGLYPAPTIPGAAPAFPIGPYPAPANPGAAPAFPTGPYPAPANPGAAPAFPTGPYPAPANPGAAPGSAPGSAPAYPTGPYSAPAGPNAGPPPAFPFGTFSVPAGPGAYGYPAPSPAQSGYNTSWPQQAPPHGYPAAPFPPSSVQHPPPNAPPLSQQGGGPPTYVSLFPPSQNTSGSSEMDKKQ